MAVDKKYTFRGLNTRDSQINKNPEYAEDLRNVLLNNKRELIKRYGYDETIVSTGILDIIEFVSANKIMAIKSDGLYEIVAGAWQKVPFAGDGTTFTTIVDHDEYNNVLYISDTSGLNYPYKYDGSRFYRMGIPQVNVTSVTDSTVGGARDYYYRVYWIYRDYKKNIVVGDYFQTAKISTTGIPVFNVDTLNATEFNYNVTDSPLLPVGIAVAYSSNSTYGYNFISQTSEGSPSIYSVDHSGATDAVDIRLETAIFGDVPLDDFYDPTVVRVVPPKARYLKITGSIMVVANVDNDGSITNVNTNNSLYWSDVSVGSNIESFGAFNRQQVGKTSEGNISGLFSNRNEITIFKTKQIYFINGILVDRAFKLISSLSAGIGCVSHKSIVEVDGGCLFQASRGIYFVGSSGQPVEISDAIDSMFTEDTTGLDFTTCRALRSTNDELLYFFIESTTPANSLIFVYDYYYKEWFLFDNYDASAGFVMLNDVIYHSDGLSLFTASSSFNDAGSAIIAYYQTGFNHLGFPSLFKKFIRAIILSIGSTSWSCNMRSRVNWNSSDLTDVSFDFNSNLSVIEKPLNKNNCYALSLMIRNEEIDQGMLVSGYEIEYEVNQKMVKGDT